MIDSQFEDLYEVLEQLRPFLHLVHPLEKNKSAANEFLKISPEDFRKFEQAEAAWIAHDLYDCAVGLLNNDKAAAHESEIRAIQERMDNILFPSIPA